MNVIVLMAGRSDKFLEEGYKYPKHLIEIYDKPVLEHVINNLQTLDANFIFMIKKEDSDKWHLDNVIKLLLPSATVIQVETETKGAACTALYAIECIDAKEPLIIINGDQILDLNLSDFYEAIKINDAGTIVFESVHPRWSYVKLDNNGYVIEASEKYPISKLATAGVYYYKYGEYFIESAKEMIKKDANVNGLYYISMTFNEMILDNKDISTFSITRQQYHSLSTVEGLKQYENHLSKGSLT